SPMRLTFEHAVAFAEAISTPTCLVLANQGVMAKRPQLRERSEGFEHIQTYHLDGGHHLHLEEPAPAVATIINSFFRTLARPGEAAGQSCYDIRSEKAAVGTGRCRQLGAGAVCS